MVARVHTLGYLTTRVRHVIVVQREVVDEVETITEKFSSKEIAHLGHFALAEYTGYSY
jgi:hypothetical protein